MSIFRAFPFAYPDDRNKDRYYDYFMARNEWIKQFCSGKDVLDTACGCGWGMSIYGTEAASLTGIDSCIDGIEYGKQKFDNLSLDYGNVLELPYNDRTFDVVVSSEIIEHLTWEDAIRYVREMYRVLKPGGMVVLTTPDIGKDHTHELSPDPQKQYQGHITMYDREGLIKQFSPFVNVSFTETDQNIHYMTALKGKKVDVSIGILSLERLSKTLQCIESIRNYTNDYELILLDNGSKSYSVLQGLKKFKEENPDIRLVYMRTNLGVGQGRQFMIPYTMGEYIVFLDNDMLVTKNWVKELQKRFMNDPKRGAVCCQVIIKKGDKYFVQLNGRMIVDGKIDASNDMQPLGGQKSLKYMKCDIIHGGATMYRREVFDVCSYDDRYFIGCEDLDFMMQMREKGYELYNCPLSRVYHYPDIAVTDRYTRIRRNQEEINKSIQLFERKWGIKI